MRRNIEAKSTEPESDREAGGREGVMTPAEQMLDFLQKEYELDRRGFDAVVPKGTKTPHVGKHEACNYAHLRAVIEEARETCPRAADTIVWLLWHRSLRSVRNLNVGEHLLGDDNNQAKEA